MSFLPVDFHFLRPWWFLALIPGLFLMYAVWRRKGSGANLQRLCDSALLPYLLLNGQALRKRRNLPLLLLSFVLFLLVVSLAGPVWKRQQQPVFRVKAARVLVLDLSSSMAAVDLSPSRLDRAVYELRDILDRSREGRTGLVVFAGEAHIVVPLTDDVETIKSMLAALKVGIIPAAGDLLSPALEQALTLLRRGNASEGDIIVLTDGVADLAGSMGYISSLRKQGITLSVLALGTEQGAPIPTLAGGFETGKNGETLMAALDKEVLQELAAAGGGRFSLQRADDQDVETLLAASNRHNLDKVGEEEDAKVELWQEEGVYLVPLILLLAALGLRRGWLVCLAMSVVLQSAPAWAMEWVDLWQRPDQRAAKVFDSGRIPAAAGMFSDPKWKATAQYESGDYQAAIDSFGAIPGQEYNLGNALAKAKHFEEALAAYDQALKDNPDNKDALMNRELVKKLLEKKKEQQEQQDQQDQKPNNKKSQDGKPAEKDKSGQQDSGDKESQAKNNEPGSPQNNPGNKSQSGEKSGQDAQQQPESSGLK